MKVLVLVKEVPDTYGDRVLDLETGLADRAASDRVLDEIGERAVEAAIVVKESNDDVEVVVMSMGPESVGASIRKALAMGADRAVHVQDPALAGADLTATSEVLAAAIRAEGFDLVVAGNVSTDGGGGAIPAMLAERLGVVALTSLNSLELVDGVVRGGRMTDGGTQRVSAALPAVVAITEALPDARFPNFKGIMAAKKKPLGAVSLADLDLSITLDSPRSIMTAIAARPPRAAGTVIADKGDAGTRLADYLVSNKLV